MGKTKYLIVACIGIILAGGLYYFLKDEQLMPKAPVQVADNEQAAVVSYIGNSIIEEKDGKRLWELGAETIEVDAATKNVKFKNLKGVFYQEKGGKIDITAPEAIMDNKNKDISMNGKVQAVASDGATFTAQETRWSNKERRFYGAGSVSLTKDDTVMTGDKIESDANMENIKVSGHAKITKGGTPR